MPLPSLKEVTIVIPKNVQKAFVSADACLKVSHERIKEIIKGVQSNFLSGDYIAIKEWKVPHFRVVLRGRVGLEKLVEKGNSVVEATPFECIKDQVLRPPPGTVLWPPPDGIN